MSNVAIKVESISKLYELGEFNTGSLSHDINRWWAKKRGKEDPFSKIDQHHQNKRIGNNFIWALKDIDFSLVKGEALGIIGKNGAGKSTLLKILSKVTAPTKGRIKLNGRIASLLEIGTGFHPEMTGRENIFLNGAILGMTNTEIKRKFDEIVAFSGVEKYIDTPVKRYSSGMYVRLAFAVAAHLESEILIVDEVLAVGDFEFQQKCLGKMNSMSKGEGRTVLFVSHNLSAISQLCTSALMLENGKIKMQGDIDTVLKEYTVNVAEENLSITDFGNYNVLVSDLFIPLKFGIVNDAYLPFQGLIHNAKPINVYVEFESRKLDDKFTFGIAVFNQSGQLLFWSQSKDEKAMNWPDIKVGVNKIVIELPPRFLNEGYYTIALMSSIHYRYWIIDPKNNPPCLHIHIQGGLSDSEFWIEKRPGVLAPVLSFREISEPIQ